MTRCLNWLLRLSLAVGVTVIAMAQTGGTITSGGQAGAIYTQVGPLAASAFFTSAGPPFQSITGRLYSAEQILERVQTLGDGTHINQTTQQVKFYRDSAGRTRTEHIYSPPPGAVMASIPSMIQIADPVAGYRYTLDSRNQIARRLPWQPQQTVMRGREISSVNAQPKSAPSANGAGTGAVSAANVRPRPEISNESLGTQTIEGIVAEGRRTTMTYPVGSFGNDRPVTTVTETWMSPDLKIMVLSKSSDPRFGESTTKLTNISQAEPDPALFQVPAEYSIVDEQMHQ